MSWAPVTKSLGEALPTREVAEDGTYDVLMLGNSYTSQNSLSSRVQALFDSTGTSASVSDLTGGGMKLYQHADNAESSGNQWNTALTTNQYDFVILQDQSQVPSFPTTEPMWQNSKNGAIRLDSMIEAAGAETIFFMTWGYRDGDSNNAWLNPDYLTMQANLESGYNMYAENITTSEREPYIAPVGLAYKAIYDEIVADGGTPTDQGTLFYNLYSGDGSHPSTRGTYLAACVMHSTISGESSIGLPDPFGLDENTRLALQQAADSVIFDDTLGYSYPWQNEPASDIWNESPFRDIAVPENFTFLSFINYSDVGILINNNSEDSKTIGYAFVAARNISPNRIFLFDNDSTPVGETINPNQFDTYFADPLREMISNRNLTTELNYLVQQKVRHLE